MAVPGDGAERTLRARVLPHQGLVREAGSAHRQGVLQYRQLGPPSGGRAARPAELPGGRRGAGAAEGVPRRAGPGPPAHRGLRRRLPPRRSGTLRVLVATSTLSSGVNLPARRVIVRSPTFAGRVLEAQTYRQMIGRAGRMGRDTAGESYLLSQRGEQRLAEQLVRAELAPVQSCLGEGHLSASLKRAVLEVVASGAACTPAQLQLYAGSTLLAATQPDVASPIAACVRFLVEEELVREGEGGKYVATPLGQACLAASLPPDQGLELFAELGRARQCFVLDNDLHVIYQVTPYSVSSQWGNLDWLHMLSLWEELSPGMRRVGELVGVEERFIVRAMRGTIKVEASKQNQKLSIHRRFYTALALQDLVNEVPLADVASKFRCSRGMLQSLQQSAATFAGMVTAFCRRLGWASFELLVSQFQDRLQFGVRRELCDLMRLDALNGPRARALFDTGITTLSALAVADVTSVEDALHKAMPFQTSKELDGETSFDTAQRNKMKHVWVTGRRGLTEREAAELLVAEARDLLRKELGVADVKWDVTNGQSSFSDYGSEDSNHGKSQHKQIDVSDIVDTYLVLKTHSRTQDHDMEVEKNDHAVASQKISACSDATSVQFQNEVCEGDKVEGLGITSRAPSPVNFLWPGQSKSKFHLQSQHDDRKTCGETVNDLEEPCSKSNTHAAVHPDPEMSPAPVICSMKVDSDKSARGESPYRKSVAEQVAVSTPRGVVRDEIMDYFSSPFELASSSVTGEHRDVPGGAGRQSPSFGGGACISPIAADRSNSTKDSSDLFSSPSAGTCSNLFVDSLLIDTQLKGVLDACQSKPAEVSQASPEAEYSSPVINKLKMTTKKATDRTKQKKSKHSSEMINTPLTSRSELDRKGLQKKSSVTKKGRRKVSVSTLRWSVDENSSLDQYKYAEDFELKTVANISSPWLRSEGKTVHIFEPEDLEELQSSFRVLSDNSVLNGTKDSVLAEDRITGKPSSSTSSELKVGSLNCEKSETCNDSEPHGKENLDVDVLSIKPEALEVDDIITDSFLEKAFTTYWSAGSGQEGSPNNNEECVSLSPEPLQKSNRNSLCKKLFSSTGKVTRQDEMGKKRPLSLGMKKFKIHPSAKQCNSAVKSSSRNLELLSRTSPENKQCDSSKHPAVTYGNTNATSVFSDEFAGSLKTPKKKSPGALKQKCNLEDDKLLENYSSDDNIVLSSQNDSDSTVNSPWKSKSLYIYSPSIKKQQTSTKHPQTAVDKTVSGKSRTSSTVDQKMKKESWTSVNIIDVCGDAQLLDTFRTELRGQRCVSLSVGCERVPEEPGIGARIMGRRPQAVPGPMLQSGERAVSGVAVCFGERDAYYISLSARQGRVSLEERLAVVRSMAQGAEWLASLRVFDCKEQAKVLGRCCGLALHCPCAEDPKVADWLLQPDGREKNLQALCLTYAADLVWVADKAGPVRGVGSPALSIGSSVPARLRCCMEAVVTWHVAQAQRRVLEERGLLALYSEVEMPTQLCLARSELAGLGFSRPEAERLRALLEGHMGGLERRAYQLAGHPFSLSSPADVAKVLYRELRLGGGKVPGGKQRPSTNKEALMRLKGDHPLPGIILQWRKLSSTVTKMVFPLLNTCVGERMYGCSVTHTATGRISMHEPNLQNIPRDFDISSPDGKHIPVSMRLAFVAGEGRSFVSADYSQLELRLLAHFSADPLLCSILNSGHDVFTSIASSWNKIPEAEVLTELRQRAKQICYGMIYGMGTKALAEQMEVDELVAANFVDSFNRAYPGVKQFLQQAVSQCRSAGYVETLRGRRRYLPAISSPNALLRSHAERQAVNSTIQGSAADVAKLAMVRVDGRLREAFPAILGQGEDHEQPPARLVLHLHDELLYEVSDAKLREVASIIKTNMEAAVSLSVQLPVKMRAGRSWGSLTDLDV
ncbi:DNA polymerase theta-like isoform X2 [Bacillus rossius redtenbacheri]|uniref:DNA polymerase theta-like isoform X2 n=1 Tax=Bacillus rossius redtenbacheri TaxID=93214 RepID=UPI002FDE8C4F